jgi:hypothetical protein
LSWKIGAHTSQREVYQLLRALPRSKRLVVLEIARRWGKSFLGCLLALEDCLQNPGVNVFVLAPTLKHAANIVAPLVRQLTLDAPEGLVRRTKSEYRWVFENGSALILGSLDTAVESVRGQAAFQIYCEETGFVESVDDYEYIFDSVLWPTLLHSGGRITHLTTPPKLPDHPFLTVTVPQAELAGTLYVRTIEDNPLLTPEQVAEAVAALGGPDSPAVQREFYCRVVRDESTVLVPEFSEERHVKVSERPSHYFAWVGGDLGGTRDKTCVLFCAFDFERAKVLVLGEVAADNETPTSTIATELKALEAREPVKPQRRWLDGSGQTLTDLRVDHKIACSLPDKTDFDAGIHMLRYAFEHDLIEIDPSCKLLIATLRSGTYSKNRDDYARTNALGHCDAVAALVYAYRMRNKSNPYPAHLGKSRLTHHLAETPPQSNLKALLGA